METNNKSKTLPHIIAVDFDGTLCENAWPDIGEANLDLIVYLRWQQNRGTKVILWTCRTGDKLDDAVRWCANRELYFDAVNENIPEAVEYFGDECRKIFAHVYIDDRASTPEEYKELLGLISKFHI